MSKDYSADIDLQHRNDPHTKLLLLAGQGVRVLDVGCSRGEMARELKGRGCTVTGVELDPDAARAALKYCERVIVGDLDVVDLGTEISGMEFDVALFGDILEHLKSPQNVLTAVRDSLAPGGFIGVSVPNIAHGSIRLMLLKGDFDYQELGILDDTHLKYYTKKSICTLLENCGYVVENVDWVAAPITERQLRETLDPLGLHNIELIVNSFATPEAVARQYVIKARPASEPDRVALLAREKVKAEREVEQLKGVREELLTSDHYARDLEAQIERKNAYIASLEASLSERDRVIAAKDSTAGDAGGESERRGILKRRGGKG